MKKFSLSRKALLALFLILLPIFITFVYGYGNNSGYLKAEILEDMTVVSEGYEAQVYLFLEMIKRRAEDFSSDGFIKDRLVDMGRGRNMPPDGLDAHLIKNKRPLDRTIHAIYVLTPDGRAAASTDPSAIGKEFSKEPFFINGKKGSSITETYSTDKATPLLAVSTPIIGRKSREPIGVIVNLILLSELNKLMKGEFVRELGAVPAAMGRRPTMEAYIVNRDRLMLTESVFIRGSVLRQAVDTLPVNECLKEGKELSSFYKGYRGVTVAGASICLPSLKWTLLVEIEEAEVLSPLKVILTSAVISGAVVAALIAALFILFLKYVVRPLDMLSSATKKMAGGDYDITLPVETTDEIGKLSSSFNSMAGTIRENTLLLRKSEEKYRTLFEESKDVIFMGTPDGKAIDINPAGVDLFGYSSKEEMLKISIARDIYNDPKDRDRFREEIEAQGFVRNFEAVLKKRDGELVHALISANVMRDDKGGIKAYRGIIHDMTAYKKLEQQLFQAQKMEAIGQLTGGIAHDFNNILTAMIGYGNLLQMKTREDDPLRAYVEPILTLAERAANLTQGLLAFSRKQIISPRPIRLNNVVRGIERLVSRLIKEDIELKTALTDKDPLIMADPGQIEQVIMNLATNARDAMPDGGRLTIATETAALDAGFIHVHGYGLPGDYALITVTDTGTGMDKGTLDKIFVPFFTTKEVGKGTGLGLSIVYGIVKQNSGYINVYSELGRGTAFKIYLPIAKGAVEEIRPAMPQPPIGGTETILVAEDDPEVRKLTKVLLEEFGYCVIEAVDGEDAVRRFIENRGKVGLVILDAIMPRKNGREAYEEILKTDPLVKALFLSGYTEDIILKKGILEKGFNFLSKPVSPTGLLKKIREIIDSAGPAR